MQAPIGSVRVDLPLPVSANAETVVNLWKAQSALLKQCPAYPTTPAVESAVADADAAVVVLDGTCAKIGQLWAQIKTLETTRETQVATVRLKHDAVETACNTASNNDPEAAKAWTGKTKSRAKPVLAAASNGPPENPALRSIKKQIGERAGELHARGRRGRVPLPDGRRPEPPGELARPRLRPRPHVHLPRPARRAAVLRAHRGRPPRLRAGGVVARPADHGEVTTLRAPWRRARSRFHIKLRALNAP